LTLLISSVAIGGAKKIILFGVDGYRGVNADNLNSFYKPELQAEERKLAIGDELGTGIVTDTNNFIVKFWGLYRQHCRVNHVEPAPIFNCSDHPTIYRKLFNNIKYSKLKEVINE
jgi:hypothetical protein